MDERQHIAVLREPEEFERFEDEQVADGVSATMGVGKDGEKKLQSVAFNAATFSQAEAEQWLKDKEYTPIRTKWLPQSSDAATVDAKCGKKKEVRGEETPNRIAADYGKPGEEIREMLKEIHAYNKNHDPRTGRFASRAGASTSSSKGNASREFANAASEAARAGVGSHREAASAHRKAAEEHKRIADRSARELESARERGDKVGEAAHQTELRRATENAMRHERLASQHDSTPDTYSPSKSVPANSKRATTGRGRSTTGRVGRFLLRNVGRSLQVGSVAVTVGTAGVMGPVAAPSFGLGAILKRLGRKKPSQGPSLAKRAGAAAGRSAKRVGTDIGRGVEQHVSRRGTQLAKIGIDYAVQRGISKMSKMGSKRESVSSASAPPSSSDVQDAEWEYTSPSSHVQDAEWEYTTPRRASSSLSRRASSSLSPSSHVQDAEWEYTPPRRRRLTASEQICGMIAKKAKEQHASIHAGFSYVAGDIVASDITSSIDIQAAGSGRLPRFQVAPAYNGGPLTVGGYNFPIIVDLKGLEVNSQSVAANLHHDSTRLVGHVDTVENDHRQLRLSGPISGASEASREFQESHTSGFPWKASIEARPLEKPEMIPAGERVFVNGQTFDGPVLVARKAELYGVSFVPRGADDSTIVSIAASAARTQGESTMPQIAFADYCDTIGVTAEDLEANPAMSGRIKAKYDTFLAQEDEEEEDKDEEEEEEGEEEEEKNKTPVAARQFDVESIRVEFDSHGDELEVIFAQFEDLEDLDQKAFRKIRRDANQKARTMKADAIKKRVLPQILAADYRAERAMVESACKLEKVRAERPTVPDVFSSRPGGDVDNEILAAAVMDAGGWDLREVSYNERGNEVRNVTQTLDDIFPDKVRQAAHDRFKRGIGLQQLLIEAAQRNGWRGNYFRSDMHECMRYAMNPPIHAAPSTADISGLLSNVANKFLLRGFFFVEQKWREIAAIGSVQDFKTKYQYRLTGADEFKLVPPGGEIKHGTLGEEEYTVRADTYGLMLNVTRQDMINDDLGALTTVPQKLGTGAGKALNKIFWTEFLGQLATMFTAARLNYFSGADTALSIDSLTTAEQMFMDLKDSDGEPIGHTARLLLASTSLSATSAQLFNSLELRQTGSTDATYPVNNPHQGKFQPVISRYVGNSAYTGYTTTGWGIFADPAEVPTIEMAFLMGNESPTIEQAGIDANFSSLDIQMRAYLDFGCNTQDYRGGVWSKGAS